MKVLNSLFLLLFIFLLLNFFYDFQILRNFLNKNQQQLITKYVFPQKNIDELEKEIETIQKESNLFKGQKRLLERAFQDMLEDIEYLQPIEEIFEKLLSQVDPYEFDMHIKSKNSNLEYIYNSSHSFTSNILDVDIYNPEKNILMYGIANQFPASGYIDEHNNKLILLSASGILAYSTSPINKLNKELILKQINTNIHEFINEDQFKKSRQHNFDWLEGGWYSTKDIQIYEDDIYVSYTREVTSNCWNTSLLEGKMNYNFIKFDILFTSDECVHVDKNIDKEFNAHQSGGRITNLNKDTVLLSTGDFRSRHRVQNKNSIFGKIIKISKNNKDYSIISMGHRNPQGLFYDKVNNFLLEAEHGPEGGDEINLIQLNENSTPNYGWAISSYGEHYGGKKAERNKKKYEKYPLYKSHSEYGFIEPIKYFNPSIGISQIIGLDKKNKYVVASLKDNAIYFFDLINDNKIDNLERINIGERIRDMIKIENGLVLFLEDTASLAFVNLK